VRAADFRVIELLMATGSKRLAARPSAGSHSMVDQYSIASTNDPVGHGICVAPPVPAGGDPVERPAIRAVLPLPAPASTSRVAA
jgi:hypothetical protein